MDTVAESKQRTPHQDQQTQPVRRAESKPKQGDEKTGIGGMPNEPVGTRFDHGLLGGDGHRRCEGGAEHAYRVETERDPLSWRRAPARRRLSVLISTIASITLQMRRLATRTSCSTGC